MIGLAPLATRNPEPGLGVDRLAQNPITSDVPSDAPEHCPGTESDLAGKASACEGCPNQGICSTQPKGEDPDLPLIKKRLENVRHKILVLSGKGGVGKSTFTGQLAWALAATKSVEASERDGHGHGLGNLQDVDVDDDDLAQVGVMDIDICGPSLPKVFALEGETIHQSSSGWSPIYVQDNLCVMSIGFMLPSEDDAVIWRGPKKSGLIKQFLRDVDWGSLDYLLVDTPPGTSDEHLSIANFLKESGIDGAIVITTPQEVALQDVRREIDFCRKVNIPILGLVENMSGFVCPSCSKASDIFIPSTGGATQLAKESGCELLGKVPLDPRIGQCCDQGLSFMEEFPSSPATKAYLEIIAKIKAKVHRPR